VTNTFTALPQTGRRKEIKIMPQGPAHKGNRSSCSEYRSEGREVASTEEKDISILGRILSLTKFIH
jgi:hypothetical protein